MAPVIANDCKHDIGGDEQRLESVNTNYADITFKLMLLPVWVAFYIYAGQRFHVYINGRTGEVHGDPGTSRPRAPGARSRCPRASRPSGPTPARR